MPQTRIRLNLPQGELQRCMHSLAPYVVTQSHDGRIVQIPATELQDFVTKEGVNGEFVLQYNGRHQFVSLTPIGWPQQSRKV